MMSTNRPPIGDTICGGKYRVVETLRDGGSQGLHRGVLSADPTQQVLVTTLFAPPKLSVEKVRLAVASEGPAQLPLVAVSFFDSRGDDPEHNTYQKQNLAMVEQLPPGDWVGRLLGRANDIGAVVSLGLSTGELLGRAAEHSGLMVDVCPQYIWAENTMGGSLIATGLSDRYRNFLPFTGGGCSVPPLLLRRSYWAPEVYRRQSATTASLTFSLSMMMSEWATGQFPFPDSSLDGGFGTQLHGDHLPLDIPQRIAHLLHLGMRPDPAARPSLSVFLAGLEAIADDSR